MFQSLDAGSILPLQGVCDPVTGNTPLMYAAMENKVTTVMMVVIMLMVMVKVVMAELYYYSQTAVSKNILVKCPCFAPS